MSEKIIYPRPELIPLTRVSRDAVKLLRIGEDFMDLGRLGLIGEYIVVPATDICPRLYYRWNYCEGIWEIYATEHDLIGFNLGSVTELQIDEEDLDNRVTKLEEGTIPPTPSPTDPPTIPPTVPPTEPDYHSKITWDADHTGGDLEFVIDSGIIIFNGAIDWYKAGIKFPTDGNYVGVTITCSPYLWNFYKNTLKVKLKGMTYDKEIFDDQGRVTFYIFVSVPGQEVPIRFYWNDGVEEDFTVAVTQESTLKTE